MIARERYTAFQGRDAEGVGRFVAAPMEVKDSDVLCHRK
jgi:hypothetical protein